MIIKKSFGTVCDLISLAEVPHAVLSYNGEKDTIIWYAEGRVYRAADVGDGMSDVVRHFKSDSLTSASFISALADLEEYANCMGREEDIIKIEVFNF